MADDGLSKAEQEEIVFKYFGPIILGDMLCVLLYGVNLSQFVTYMHSFKSDAWTTRCMVGGLFAMCTGQVSLLVYTMWLFGVVNFGNYEVFLRESWSNTVSLSIIMSFITLTVQQYFLWRVKGFSQSWVLFSALSLCSFTATVLGLANAVSNLMSINPIALDIELDLAQATISINVFVNIMNATLLLYFLLQYRTGFARTDGVIRRLVITCVESPLLNALISLVDLIIFKTTFPSNWFILAAAPSGQIYVFSVLALLNSRTYLRHAWRGVADIDMAQLSRIGQHFNFSSEPVCVGVTVEQHAQVAVDPFASCIRDKRRHDGKRDHSTVESVIKSRHQGEHHLSDHPLAAHTVQTVGKVDSASDVKTISVV